MYETDGDSRTNVESLSKFRRLVTDNSEPFKDTLNRAIRVVRDVSRREVSDTPGQHGNATPTGTAPHSDSHRPLSNNNSNNQTMWKNFTEPLQNSTWLLHTESNSTNTVPPVINKHVPLFPNISDINFNDKGYFDFSDSDFGGYVGNFSDCYWSNDTLCSNLTNLTTQSPPDAQPFNYWALLLLIFPMFTLFGNILVVLAVYREKSLRTVTNYFIVSLAIADIMVAVLVMTLAIWVEVGQFYLFIN